MSSHGLPILLSDIRYSSWDMGLNQAILENGDAINVCHDCGILNPGLFMVDDLAWNQITSTCMKLLLCWDCSKKRYPGLSLSQLNSAPVNHRYTDEKQLMDQRLECLIPRLVAGGGLRSAREIFQSVGIELAVILNELGIQQPTTIEEMVTICTSLK